MSNIISGILIILLSVLWLIFSDQFIFLGIIGLALGVSTFKKGNEHLMIETIGKRFFS